MELVDVFKDALATGDIVAWVAFAAMVCGVLSQVAAITPWTWDDKVFGPLAKVLNGLAGNYGKAKNEKPK